MKELEIVNARIHNLKNLNLSIPKNKFVVATGISGSGKSSLIFDTIFEEGKKLYLDSIGYFSSYRDEEIVDHIKGIAPTVAVMQKVIGEKNPRSTVGTKTGILNLLASLMSIEGYFPCSSCGTSVKGALECPNCGKVGNGLLPAYFIFNSPKGMCYSCNGKGYEATLKIDDFIKDENEPLGELWYRVYIYPRVGTYNSKEAFIRRRGIQIKRAFGLSIDTKFKEIPRAIKKQIVYDKGFHYGFSEMFKWKLYHGKISDDDPYYKNKVCPKCNGLKLGDFGLNTKLNGKSIGELCTLDFTSLLQHLNTSSKDFTSAIGMKVYRDLSNKIEKMNHLGLGYLNLDRTMPTLSGGEVQRLLIMNHLENELEGLIYIFDEPTAGLHECEKQLLIDKAKELKDKGNTVLVVEHDFNTINQAEHLIDFGPMAGSKGGEIVYNGSPEGIYESERSITGKFLNSKLKIVSRISSEIKGLNGVSDFLHFYNITTNNLKGIDVSIPLNRIVGICGVSGSGKSSLINGTVVPTLKDHFKNRSEDDLSEYNIKSKIEFTGGKSLDAISVVTQAPIGRSSVSSIATYLGVWDNVRSYFLKAAGEDNFNIGDFSYNSSGGCEQCKGKGYEYIYISEYMGMSNTCRVCHGKKYKNEILEIKVNGKNISEVLDLTVTEALEYFKDNETITRKLKVFDRTGMGYITLGQSTSTISGGEAQRLKLAKQLVTRKKGHVLYIFDEPTTGLSVYDVDKFLKLINELYDEGNSVIIIEHDPDVLSFCDHLIELGPKGGDNGGYIIAEGTSMELKGNNKSITGSYLKTYSEVCSGVS